MPGPSGGYGGEDESEHTAQRVIKQYGTNDLKIIVGGETLEVRTKHPWRASYSRT